MPLPWSSASHLPQSRVLRRRRRERTLKWKLTYLWTALSLAWVTLHIRGFVCVNTLDSRPAPGSYTRLTRVCKSVFLKSWVTLLWNMVPWFLFLLCMSKVKQHIYISWLNPECCAMFLLAQWSISHSVTSQKSLQSSWGTINFLVQNT